MKRFLIPFLSLLSFKALAQSAALDAQFGNAGLAIYQSANSSEYNCLAVDAQGNIFSAGYVMTAPASGLYRLMVTKTLANGQPDQSFANNGIVEVTVNASEFPLDLALAPDGKILVSGSAYAGPTPNGPGDYNGFVVRLNSNGTLDQTFAQTGIYHFLASDSHITNIFVKSNGSVMLCGNMNYQPFVMELLDNGTVNSQYGTNGYCFFNTNTIQFVLWNAVYNEDGTIVLVGHERSDAEDPKLAYCKITPQGTYDLSFGNDGFVALDMYSGQPAVYETLTQIRKAADGKYYMGGYVSSGTILRVHPDGRVDSTFGVNGVLLNHQHPYKDFVVQPDGKLILAGPKEFSAYNSGWALTRLNADGAIDPGFANGTSFGLDISADHDYPQALKIVNGQYLIVAGSSRKTSVANATLAKIKLSSGTSIKNNIAPKNLMLYPNPVNDVLTLSAEETITGFDIVDMSGRVVLQNNYLNARTATINCTFPAGSYIIRLKFYSGAAYSSSLIKL